MRAARRGSAEQLLHLREEALGLRMGLLAGQLRELLQQLALLGGQLRGRLHDDAHVLVSPLLAVQVGDAVGLQPEDLPGLGAGGDGHLHLPVERGDIDFRAQRRVGEGDGHLAEDLVLLALEERVLLDDDGDVEVSRRTAPVSRLAHARQPHPRAVVHARGDGDLDDLFRGRLPGALAARAGVRHHRARAAAVPAGTRHREEALRVAQLPAAAARSARARARTALAAGAGARLALLRPGNRHLGTAAERGLLEGDLQVVAQVRATRAGAAPTSPATAEDVAENLAEDVVDVDALEPAAGATEALEGIARVSEAVVLRPPLGVAQHLVGLRGFLELLLGLVVPRVAIRVVLERHLAERALQLLRGDGLLDAQDLVVVAFLTRRRCWHSLQPLEFAGLFNAA